MVSTTALSNNATVSVVLDQPVVSASNNPTNFVIAADKTSISNYAKEGNDLVLEFADGRTVTIKDFFANGGEFNYLIFSSGDEHWLVDMSDALGKSKDGVDDEKVIYVPLDNEEGVPLLMLLAGLAGLGAIGGIVAASGDSSDDPYIPPAQDTTPPPNPSFVLWDYAAPKVGEIKNGEVTNDPTPTLVGSGAEPGSKIIITVDGKEVMTVVVDSDGNWKAKLPELGDGKHVVEIVAEDAAGNRSESEKIEFGVDTQAPDIPAVDAFDDNGNAIVEGQPTNDNTPTLKGTGEPGNTITIVIDDWKPIEIIVGEDGKWEYSTPELGEGSHKIVITETDEAGNVSEPKEIEVIVDLLPPGLPSVAVTEDDGTVVAIDENGQALTKDSTPTFTGETEPGSKIVIEIDGQAPVEVEVGEDGKWTYTPPELGEGDHKIVITEKNPAGTEGPSKEIDLEVDLTPPGLPGTSISEDDGTIVVIDEDGKALTKDPNPTFTGETEPGSTIVVEVDGQPPIEIEVGEDGKWEYTPPDLEEGDHKIVITEKDPAGNPGPSQEIELEVDLTPPGLPGVAVTEDDGTVVIIDEDGNALTKDPNPTFTGETEPGSTIIVEIDGQPPVEVEVGEDGKWEYTPPDLEEGDHKVVITEKDPAGNPGPSQEIDLEVDLTPPAPPKVEIVDENGETVREDKPTSENTPTIKGEGAEPGSSIEIEIDGQPPIVVEVDEDGNWSYTPEEELGEGKHEIIVTEKDKSGNESPPSIIEIEVDTIPPGQSVMIEAIIDEAPPQTGDIGQNGYTNDTTPTLTGTISDVLGKGEFIVILRDGQIIGRAEMVVTRSGETSWKFTDSGLEDGKSYTYTAYVEDAAGNRGGISAGYTINVDTTPPSQVATINEIWDDVAPGVGKVTNGGTTNDSQPELKGAIIGEKLGDNEYVAIYRDGVKIGEAKVEGSTWTFVDDTGLENGKSYVYTAQVEDRAGNAGKTSDGYGMTLQTDGPTSSATIETITDDVDPVQGVIAKGGYTNDTTPLLEGKIVGTLNSGDVLAVYRNGVKVGEATLNGDGTWKFTDSGLSDGESYTYTVRVEDAAGNFGASSNAYEIHVDTSAPTQTVTLDRGIDNVMEVVGEIEPNSTINDSTPTLEGHLSGPLTGTEKVYIIRNGEIVGEATMNPDGLGWTFTDGGLANGETYTYSAVVIDAAGNRGTPSSELTFTLDTSGVSQTVDILKIMDDVEPNAGIVAQNGFTNDTTPTLVGSIFSRLKAGEVVEIYRDGVKVGEATIGSDGLTWTFTDNLVNDGSYSYTAAVKNAAGDKGAESGSYVINLDTMAPTVVAEIVSFTDDQMQVVGTFGPGTVTNDTTPLLNGTIKGTLGDGEKIFVYRDGVKIGEAKVSADGTKWTFQDGGLEDGKSYSYTVQAEDQAGNKGSMSGSFGLTIDTSAPTQSVTITDVIDDLAPQIGSVEHNGYTNDMTPMLKGSLSEALGAGEKLVILRDGKVVAEITFTGKEWTWTDSGLVDGESYTYTARVEDAAGNRGAVSDGYTINVDTSAPTQVTTIDTIWDDVAPNVGNVTNGGTTNDSTPELRGSITGEKLGNNEYVAIYRDGVKIGEAKVDGSTWTFVDETGLENGKSYVYTAQVEDRAGNAGPASNDYGMTLQTSGPSTGVTIDTITDNVDPVQGVIEKGGYTNDTTPLLEGQIIGSLKGGEFVAVYRNGVKVGNATVNADRTWTFTDTVADDGSYSYTAVVKNAAGDKGAESNPYVINVDTTDPTAYVTIETFTDDQMQVVGDFKTDTVTNDTTPRLNGTVHGTLEAGETIVIYRDGVKIGEAKVSADGKSWTFQDGGLEDGKTYTYTAQVEDAAGNRSALSDGFNLTIDISAPTQSVVITDIQDDLAPQTGDIGQNGYTNDTTPTLNGTISDGLAYGEKVVILRDGKVVGEATINADGVSWTFTDSGLEDGMSYTYTARVEDAAGNRGAISGGYTINVDTSAPTQTTTIDYIWDDVAPGVGEVGNGGTTNDSIPELHGSIKGDSLGDNEYVAIYRDGVKIGEAKVDGSTWTFTDETGLENGKSYVYTAQVEDRAGNAGPKSNDYGMTLDTEGPTQTVKIDTITDDVDPVQGVVKPGGYTNDTTPLLEGTISAALKGGEVIAIYRNGVKVGEATMKPGGLGWSFTDKDLLDGEHYSYTARVEDAASNFGASSNTYDINVDTSGPTQTIWLDRGIDNVEAVTGNIEPNSTINDDTPTFEGHISGPLTGTEKVYIIRNGEIIGEATMLADGVSWTFTDGGLSSGETYTYSAVIMDAAGNRGTPSTELTFTLNTDGVSQTIDILKIIDDQPEVTGVVNPGETTDDKTPTIEGSISSELSAGDVIEIYRNGKFVGNATVNADGLTWTFTDNLVDDGSYKYTAVIKNAAGDTSTESNGYEIVLDTTASNVIVTIDSFTDNQMQVVGDNFPTGTVTNDTTPLLNGSLSDVLEPGEKVFIYRDGVKIGEATIGSNGTSWTFQDGGLEDGKSYNYTAQVVDAAGNKGAMSGGFDITIDTSAPTQSARITDIQDNLEP